MNNSDNDIAIPYTQPELIHLRNNIVNKLKRMQILYSEYEKEIRSIGGYPDSKFQQYHILTDKFDKEKVQKQIDKYFWQYLIQSMNIDKVMTEKKKNELYKEMTEDPAEFKEEIIDQILVQANKVYKESAFNTIKEVFETLITAKYTSGGWRSKTNKSHKIEKLWRVNFNYHWSTWNKKYEHSYYDRTGGFQDIEKAFCILDKKKLPEYPYRWCDKFDEEVKKQKVGTNVECEYFIITFYKNGNQKIVFKRLDLLEKLNQYGSNNELFFDKVAKNNE